MQLDAPEATWETTGFTLWADAGGPVVGIPISRERAAELLSRDRIGTIQNSRNSWRHQREIALEPRAYKELDPPYNDPLTVGLRVERLKVT